MGKVDDLGSVRTPRSILAFTCSSIVMMLFISSYSVIDGVFISNLIGTDALAALNITMPAFSAFGSVAFMFAAGGSTIVATMLGEGRTREANRSTFQIFFAVGVIGICISMVITLFAEDVVRALGADDGLLPYCLEYWRALAPFVPLMMMQFVSIQFAIVSGSPMLALASSVTGGFINIALDWLFMGPLGMGMLGAALASGIGSAFVACICIAHIASGRSGLRFEPSAVSAKVIVPACTNGSSEMASNMSSAVTVFLYNMVMMKHLGADGVSAITIISYVEFLAVAAIGGYSMGIDPVMSYCRGAKDRDGMRMVFAFSMKVIAVFSIAVFILMEVFAGMVVSLFSGGSEHVEEIAVNGARLYSVSFLFMGFNIYGSALFTSLSNGLVSAVIASIHGFVLLAPMILLLPELFGIDAVWLAVSVTEMITLAITIRYIRKLGPVYGFYGKRRVEGQTI